MAQTTRPRGFAPWKPQSDTLALLDTVRAILTDYEDELPLTVRQIFYRMVSQGYSKTEQAYKSLADKLNRARRAELISWQAIRDDGFAIHQRDSFANEPQGNICSLSC